MTAPTSQRDPARKYSPSSYSAQYGIDFEDAQELCDIYETHQDVVSKIMQIMANDPARKREVMFGRESSGPTPNGTPPATSNVDGLEGVGSVVAGMGMLRVTNPKPHPSVPKNQREHFMALAQTAAESEELDEWLDECIARGDHNLSEREKFVWADIPLDARKNLHRLLALRMIESKGGVA